MKRLCIYLTFDRQGIVDKYIGYILKELKTCVSYLVVVCNQPEIVSGKEIFEKYADDIFYRENIGLDTGGFKDALCDFIGWDIVLQYDELILVNDSMYGPFKPMKTIFSEMEKKDVDFWGLAKHGEGRNNEITHFPEHIQTFFLVIRSKMLHCKEFEKYWEEMPYYQTYIENVKRHEIRFTQYFSDLGYLYDTLADTDINDSIHSENNYTQFCTISYELIKKRNFPFLKKQQIVHNTLQLQTQENIRQALEYIDKETDYNVEMIWDNIIRSFDMSDLQRSIHIQYIITPNEKKNIIGNVMILVFISHKKAVEYVLEYILPISSVYSVKIVAEENEYLEDYRKQGLSCIRIRKDEKGKLFSRYSNFDYVCVLKDVDVTSEHQPSCIGKSYFYNIWENLLKDKNHISGIIEQFFKETKLGFLTSPYPNFANYFGAYGVGWDGKFEIVNQITKELKLNCQISECREPFRITDNFWVRGSVLKKLKDIKDEDYIYLPYLWSYLTQDAGYYVGIVESAEYASLNEVNLQYYLNRIATCVKEKYGDFDSFIEMEEKVYLGSLRRFCERYPKILVYGTGEIAKKYETLLQDVEAYVISDGQIKLEKMNGRPVKYLSEIEVSDDYGVVLCINEDNQKQVIPLLEQRGIIHYFCI